MKNIFQIITLASLIASQGQAMVVHEWGTFTSVQGSNGKDQMGAYHEDEKLPGFVHGFGDIFRPFPIFNPPDDTSDCMKNIHCRVLSDNRITQRMETPVIYFYNSNAFSSERVKIKVGFPEGVISETFPAPTSSLPSNTATVLKNGEVVFDIHVATKLSDLSSDLPIVPAGNIYEHARKVAANYVTVGQGTRYPQTEKFIFYRGVGTFRGPVQTSSFYDPNINTSMTRVRNMNPTNGGDPILQMVAIHIDEQGQGVYQFMMSKTLSPGHPHIIDNNTLRSAARVPMTELKSAVVGMLTNSGLYDDEANAMVNTWEHGYFKTPGLRILYVLPRANVEQILPMTITPVPSDLLRIMVGRIEVLPKDEEISIMSEVSLKGTNFNFQRLGRFAEPKLRAVLDYALTTPASPTVIASLENLIEQAKTFHP